MSQVIEVNAPNQWRLESPGAPGWARTAAPVSDKSHKYFMVSTDCHANEPHDLWAKRIEPRFRERLPRITTDENGVQWRISEGYRPDRLRLGEL